MYQALLLLLLGIPIYAFLKARRVRLGQVEEPIDVYVHRPLAYLLTRALFPLPVSPDAVTLLSILAGLASGGAAAPQD